MKDVLIVSRENDAEFKESCLKNKIQYSILREGIDGDTYEVEFDFPSELYFLGMRFQLLVDRKRTLKTTEKWTH